MANTRMYLKNTRTGDRIYLAKYYPSTGWYRPSWVVVSAINRGFDVADFGHLTEEQRAENAARQGLGVPYPSAGGMFGEEWIVEYDR